MTTIETSRKESNIGLSYLLPKKSSATGEVRQYAIFHEDDPNFPVEVIITEVPPNYIQPFHKHETINEITIVLKGQAIGITKDNNEEKEHPIQAMSLYKEFEKTHNFKGIKASIDGTLLFVLEDKKTKEISGGELPYTEGFDAKDKYHTIKNPTDQIIVIATVKFADKNIVKNNRDIFKQDKKMY
jgi:hypothetical protein